MEVLDKIQQIKYNRSTSLVRFMIDLEKMVLNSHKSIQQKFRDEFANGCMILTIRSVIGGITMDEYPKLLNFIELYFGIKYTFEF